MDDFLDDSSDIIEDIIFNSDTISETSSPSVANFLDDSASSFDDSFGATDDVGYENLGHSGFHARYADGSSFDSDFTDDSYSSYGNDFSDNSFSSFDDSFEDGYDEEEEYGNTSYGENILESIKKV